MSFKPEVIADNSGQWTPNGLRFATREEAETWVLDLSYRWLLVRDTRVVECEDPVNYKLVEHNQLQSVSVEPPAAGTVESCAES